MPALQVRDFLSDLYEELRACAAIPDRSISQQAVNVLRKYLQAYRQRGCTNDFPEPAELTRQMREDRDDQIVPELSSAR